MLSTTTPAARSARCSRAVKPCNTSICRSNTWQQGRVLAAALPEQRRLRKPSAAQVQLAATLAAAGIALPAAAADEAVSEAAVAVQEAAANDPTTLVMVTLFTVAIGALAVVTLGVAYLSYTSWNDGRLEAEDRKRQEMFRPSANSGNGAAPSKKAAAAAATKPQKEPEEYKGFGGKK